MAASLATACLAGRTSDAWTAVVMTVAIVAVITLPATIAALLRDREPSRTSPPAAQLDAEHGRAN
ncbi:hypothetical protein ACFCX0_25590 [Streptomyces sp. NPDC056352]|uniref:hypothetical protein n=1 Tax=Streptomyces sp. NPDC056352 TaxID=3345791 RepID=UPI0035DA79A3